MSGKCGEENCFSKLKRDDVIAIRVLSRQGMGNYEIAKRFGVTGTTIKKIVRREKWRWLK